MLGEIYNLVRIKFCSLFYNAEGHDKGELCHFFFFLTLKYFMRPSFMRSDVSTFAPTSGVRSGQDLFFVLQMEDDEQGVFTSLLLLLTKIKCKD